MSEQAALPDDLETTPQVASGNAAWGMPLALAAAVALGVFVFVQMRAHRLDVPPPSAQQSQAPRHLQLDPTPPPTQYAELERTPFSDVVSDAPMALERDGPLQAALPPTVQIEDPAHARLASPALVVDLTSASAAQASADPRAVAGALGAAASQSDEAYAAQLGSSTQAQAHLPDDPRFYVAEGALIPAVLETAISSDLPGAMRAIVSSDIRSFDGSRVLIPRGSRLVGQYRPAASLGQSRVFVIWTRLIRPDGVSVDLAAPGADALGRGGLKGRVDTHFLRRFGGALLLTAINVGAEAAQSHSDTQVIIDASRNIGSADTSHASDIRPTVEVRQGTLIQVFVTRQLDFSGVYAP